MSKIEWLKAEDRVAQGGLDRGVLYPKNSVAVPWNGLTDVTESGNQQTSKYYIDGRLYLNTVTPREYSATISAYTFPDEFADICGIIEAADGLFLDSQVPDQFDLSYRTHYADGLRYKIHMLYSVTASMSDTQYQTLTDSSNDPTPFEFNISAVPQPVTGFRPTAHAIVDSGKVSAASLANLESIIYGTSTADPRLPLPTELISIFS